MPHASTVNLCHSASCWSFCIVYKFLNLWYVFKPLWNLILFLIKESFTLILAGAAVASLYFYCVLLCSFEVQDKYFWGNAIKDVTSPPKDRLLHLVLFFFLTWKSTKGSTYDWSCCPHLLEVPLLPRILNALLCDDGARGRGGKAGPKIALILVPWQIKSRDVLWLLDLFKWIVFLVINFEPIIINTF